RRRLWHGHRDSTPSSSRRREAPVAIHGEVPLAACVWIAASAFGLLAMTEEEDEDEAASTNPWGRRHLACASDGAAGAGGEGVAQARTPAPPGGGAFGTSIAVPLRRHREAVRPWRSMGRCLWPPAYGLPRRPLASSQ